MDRVFAMPESSSGAITPLDRLAFLGSRTMGALTYQPATDLPWTKGSAVDLSKLARAAIKVIEGDAQELLPELVRAGGSPGGARPNSLSATIQRPRPSLPRRKTLCQPVTSLG